jgi:hypothetical protein
VTEKQLATLALWAGYGGLLPFVAAWLLALLAGSEASILQRSWALPLAESLALSWGAIILTFVAAVHWGLAVAGRWVWTVSTVLGAILPSVVALGALLIGGVQGIAVLVAGFGVFWLYEHHLCAESLPADYLALRRWLTLSVCALLTLTAFTLDAGWST